MIDLHIHSDCSDGLLSVKQLTDLIKNLDLEFCSLTDHDTVDGVKEFINNLNGEKVKVISGVELTALYKNREIHILAYNFDVDKVEKILKKRNKIVSQKKIKELEEAKKLFLLQGFEISDFLKVDKNKPVGLTVALDVYNNPKNQDKLLNQYGIKISPKEFYDSYQALNTPCFVPRSGVSIDWILKQFKGVAKDLILAHPFNPVSFLVPPLSLDDINDLIKLGIEGIEIYHPDLDEEQINILEKIVLERKLKFTGGSDFHGKDNNKKIGFYSGNKSINFFKLHGF